eukprot:7398628-Heterocapsa_arctica.AAC.1
MRPHVAQFVLHSVLCLCVFLWTWLCVRCQGSRPVSPLSPLRLFRWAPFARLALARHRAIRAAAPQPRPASPLTTRTELNAVP